MPPVSGHKKLAEAVFTSINEGNYAADQDVASAELQSTALESLSALLDQARVEVKNSISELSRLSAADIDGWIAQSKQLREDIIGSEKQSREIVSFAESGQDLKGKAEDALAKVNLLEGEVAFNDILVETLKNVQEIKTTLDGTAGALKQGQLLEASRHLIQAETKSKALEKSAGSTMAQVIGDRVQKNRMAILDAVEDHWNQLIVADKTKHRVTIYKEIIDSSGSLTLEQISQTLDVLGLLESRHSVLVTIMGTTILDVLLRNASNKNLGLQVDNDKTIEIIENTGSGSAKTTLEALRLLQKFCRDRLPDRLWSPFDVQLNAHIVDGLLSGTLVAAVPSDLGGMQAFQQTIEGVKAFAQHMDKQNVNSSRRLLSWAAESPKVWLARYCEGSLNSIRQLLKRGLGQPRQVERVETQIVRDNDEVFATNGAHEDWNADWSDEEETQEANQDKQHSPDASKNGAVEDEDEDMSGWGFDNEDEGETTSPTKAEPPVSEEPKEQAQAEDDEGDAWGWQDEPESPKELRSTQTPKLPQSQVTASVLSPRTANSKQQEREVTLRETYHVTALPEQILDIIVMVIEDGDSLSHATSSNPVASAAGGLYLLPGFLLSMYRASAPTFYTNNASGSMFLYNDSLYLSDRLRSYIKHRESRQLDTKSLSTLIKMDITDLETFGKRAYGRDMESTRTTLIDLLDGAQGFSSSTQEPFASQCDLAISSVIDYLRQIHGQWSRVLSQSALLQSIGSLLTTITNKMIIDIEDMSDISEPESQRLVSFCKSITTLEDLFLPPMDNSNSGEPPIPLTAGYTKTWLRFQYLSNILESSLADIKYLWIEGELSIEFSADEVVDLIEALFADSDHRRRAITDIRRSR